METHQGLVASVRSIYVSARLPFGPPQQFGPPGLATVPNTGVVLKIISNLKDFDKRKYQNRLMYVEMFLCEQSYSLEYQSP